MIDIGLGFGYLGKKVDFDAEIGSMIDNNIETSSMIDIEIGIWFDDE